MRFPRSFLLVTLGNVWIWKVIAFAPIVGLVTLGATALLFSKSKLFLFFLALLMLFQLKTTQVASPTALSNDEQRVQYERLSAYPRSWLRVGWWLEGRKESIAARRIQQNFFEAIDPNLYFFGNHPRSRVGIKEFEKFPWILLPFFVIGLLSIDWKGKDNFLALVAPLTFVLLLGHQNPLGPVSLFPFLAATIVRGLEKLKDKRLVKIFAVLFILVFLQTILYAKS